MKSVYNFVVTPKGDRYTNIKKIGDSELILNTEIFNHQYVNREAKVLSTPLVNNTEIREKDEVIIHHNVFRRWHNVRGEEKNSKSYLWDNKYLIAEDQIFLYKRHREWKCLKGYCFIQPIKDTEDFTVDKEKALTGIVVHSDGTIKEGELVSFRPGSEYEFIINGKRLYRILSNFITIKYEYQGNEEEYNPSWAESS